MYYTYEGNKCKDKDVKIKKEIGFDQSLSIVVLNTFPVVV